MSAILEGGLRHRLIRDSLFDYLEQKLGLLGWFDPGEYIPITLWEEPVPNDTEIPFNSLAMEWSIYTPTDTEIGSNFAEHEWQVYVDFYAENDAIGMHFIGDVAAILDGRMPSIGCNTCWFPVQNRDDLTPSTLFYCEANDIRIDRARDFPDRFRRAWWSCRTNVIDYHGSDA